MFLKLMIYGENLLLLMMPNFSLTRFQLNETIFDKLTLEKFKYDASKHKRRRLCRSHN